MKLPLRVDLPVVALGAAMVVALGVMAYAVLVLRPGDSPTALVLATSTATPGGPTRTELPLGPTAMPWVDSTEGPTPTPSPPPSYSYPDVRPCVAADLAGSRGEGQGINAGEAEAGIVFTNTSRSVCKLEGVPTIQFVDEDGTTQQASWREFACQPQIPPCQAITAVLEPDHGQTPAPNYVVKPSQTSVLVRYSTGAFDAQSSTPCPNMAKAILITLPDGGGSLNLPLTFGNPCRLPTVGQFQPAPTASPVRRPATYVRLVLPQSVVAGSTLDFQVAVSNLTSTDYKFADPCPNFGMLIYDLNISERHSLNCRPVGPVPPGGTASFDMQTQIPASAVLGSHYIDWWCGGVGGAEDASPAGKTPYHFTIVALSP